MAGGYLSVFRGSGIEFDTVREYDDGDDPRSIDWNVTARMGRPFVKTYVDERELTDALPPRPLRVDGGRLRRSGPRARRPRASARAWRSPRSGTATRSGSSPSARASTRASPPRKGVAHALRIVRDCLAPPARTSATTRTRAGAGLRDPRRPPSRRAVRAVRLPRRPVWERPLALCARRHDVIAVRLLLPELRRPRAAVCSGSKTRRRGARSSSTARAAARARPGAGASRRWRADTDRSLRRARVDVMDVRVPTKAGGRTASRSRSSPSSACAELRGAKR